MYKVTIYGKPRVVDSLGSLKSDKLEEAYINEKAKMSGIDGFLCLMATNGETRLYNKDIIGTIVIKKIEES